jgi:hypothetical protein
VPPIGLGQAVTFFEKTLKKAAISPKPLWQALYAIEIKEIKNKGNREDTQCAEINR